MDFSEIISFILEPNLEGALGIVRTIFIVISLLMIIGIIFFLAKSSWLRARIGQDIIDWKKYKFLVTGVTKQWSKISGRLKSTEEFEWKLALIEAEDLLDKVLQKIGIEGKGVGERLRNTTSATLPNIDEARRAHDVCSDIARDPDYRLTQEKAEQILKIYEKAFQDLEAF